MELGAGMGVGIGVGEMGVGVGRGVGAGSVATTVAGVVEDTPLISPTVTTRSTVRHLCDFKTYFGQR